MDLFLAVFNGAAGGFCFSQPSSELICTLIKFCREIISSEVAVKLRSSSN
jgi:hypothetical protein